MSGLPRRLPLDQGDLELIEVARDLLLDRFALGRHQVAAALRVADGTIVTGLHVGSRRINLCAEQIALGTALTRGHGDIVAGVAVIAMEEGDDPVVTSPCGVCREVLAYYAPEMTVLVDDAGTVVKTFAADLLPAPWLLPTEGSGPPLLPDISTEQEEL